MYAFIPGFIFLGVGIMLYRIEWKKQPEDRNKVNIMLASYACIMGVALGIISFLYWGEV